MAASWRQAVVHAHRLLPSSSSRGGTGLIVRVPTTTGWAFTRRARSVGIEYAVEVVGDPRFGLESTAGGTTIAALLTRAMRSTLSGASAVTYVTRFHLQDQFPAPEGVPTFSASNVDLTPDWFRPPPIQFGSIRRIVSPASLEFGYKGTDILIRAISTLNDMPSLEVVLAGTGRLSNSLKELATELGVEDRVHFAGRLSHDDLRSEYERADLVVLPSRTEGLPRAALEAMAFGVPVLGTTVGGFPEILPAIALVTPGDVPSLANGIRRFNEPALRQEVAQLAHVTAMDYSLAVIARERSAFLKTYLSVLEGTQNDPI